ncbi:MAG: hypothetical protein EBV06_04935 [Planctomycetia bacterium]|jgi:uncharacterized membrane protein|nr:hypothetical protein [Planctomycetia bacterium]
MACVEKAIEEAEATPAMARAGRYQAGASASFVAIGWGLAILGVVLFTIARLTKGENAPTLALNGIILAAVGVLPAAIGVGQAVAALRGQTEWQTTAWAGLVLGGVYVGLMIGLGTMGLWQGG